MFESGERTVKIPVVWKAGCWQLLTGGSPPELRDGTIVDWSLSASSLVDPNEVERWTREITVPFLPAGTELFSRVSPENMPREMLDKTVEKSTPQKPRGRFVQIFLQTDLSINYVPGKLGSLNDCRCTIPSIHEEAQSINEAYKKIAMAFEPSRRSNSGNVFSLVFIERNHRMVKLSTLRDELHAKAWSMDQSEQHKDDVNRPDDMPAADQASLFDG